MISPVKKLTLLVSSLLLSSCEIILDEALDCLNNDSPQFNQGTLPDAVLNQMYSTTIRASIKNNPTDDSYNYAFNIRGDLPDGIFRSHNLGGRELHFGGTPTQLGSHSFRVEVIVTDHESYLNFEQSEEYYDDGDSLCHNKHAQTFVIRVVEESTQDDREEDSDLYNSLTLDHTQQ